MKIGDKVMVINSPNPKKFGDGSVHVVIDVYSVDDIDGIKEMIWLEGYLGYYTPTRFMVVNTEEEHDRAISYLVTKKLIG